MDETMSFADETRLMRATARECAAQGLRVFSVRRKRPVPQVFVKGRRGPQKRWVPLRTRRARPRELDLMFGDWLGADGFAIITGPSPVGPSLAVRDFDSTEGYWEWAARHPEAARRLAPATVATHRGFHVYVVLPAGHPECYHVFADAEGKGELLATPRRYVVGPGTRPPSGPANGSFSSLP